MKTALPGALLVLLAPGCVAPSYDGADDGYYRNDPDRVTDAYRAAIEDRGRNALVGVEKLLSAALLRHDWTDAESLAVRASTLCNIFVAGEPGERDALSLFGRERDKPFKGEPHERAMVDFYLGVLRLRRGDPEGALAAFRSALQKDRGSYLLPVDRRQARRGAANARRYLYESDYALLEVLAAKCYQLLDEPEGAERHLARACEILPPMKPLFDVALDPETNVLVLVEGGRAPTKRRSGPQGAVLAYAPAPETRLEEVELGGVELSHGQVEDLYWQATTVGGRKVDQLNRDKAARQEALELAGFATAAAGAVLAHAGSARRSRELQAAGLIGLGVGIATMVFAAAAIDPNADLRAWTTLPGQVFLAAGHVPPGAGQRLRVRARGCGDLSQEWTGVPVSDGVNVYWIRLLPGRTGGAWSPPGPGAPTLTTNPRKEPPP